MKKEKSLRAGRREFLGKVSVASATIAASVVGLQPLLQTEGSQTYAAPAASGSNQRVNECAKLRRDAAQVGLQNTPQNLQHPRTTMRIFTPIRLPAIRRACRTMATGQL